MKELVAKRYVKALVQSCSDEELKGVLLELAKISAVYGIEKFRTILESPDVNKSKKLEFLLSMVENNNSKIQNLIKLLNEKDRLMIIPSIKKELQTQVSLKENIFEGEVLSNWYITKEQLAKLEKGFGRKFGATVKLESKQNEYPGIKISLDELGIEASFSVDRLKAQMAEHILKAI